MSDKRSYSSHCLICIANTRQSKFKKQKEKAAHKLGIKVNTTEYVGLLAFLRRAIFK